VVKVRRKTKSDAILDRAAQEELQRRRSVAVADSAIWAPLLLRMSTMTAESDVA
jgi:hypothetical protein